MYCLKLNFFLYVNVIAYAEMKFVMLTTRLCYVLNAMIVALQSYRKRAYTQESTTYWITILRYSLQFVWQYGQPFIWNYGRDIQQRSFIDGEQRILRENLSMHVQHTWLD